MRAEEPLFLFLRLKHFPWEGRSETCRTSWNPVREEAILNTVGGDILLLSPESHFDARIFLSLSDKIFCLSFSETVLKNF